MSFIGNIPAEAYSTVAKDTFSGNGSTTDFTLSLSATTNGVEVFVENVQQEPTTAYTISGTTLSFTAAPVSGTNNIYVIHRGPAVQTVVPPAGVAIDASSVTASGNLSVTGTTTLTDDLNVDSGTLFVDASANRVGIGTSSPAAELEIEGATPEIRIDSTDASARNYKIHSDGDELYIEGIGSSGSVFFGEDGTYGVRIDLGTGRLDFNSGYGSVATAYGCRAWVQFSGDVSGSPVINGSGNISSISDQGTGHYYINITTAMPDANFACSSAAGTGVNNNRICSTSPRNLTSTNQITVLVADQNGTTKDDVEISISVFR